MSKLSEFMKAQETQPKTGMEIDINATCHTCNERVNSGEYFPNDKVLKWTCSQGHVSFIEGFKLF